MIGSDVSGHRSLSLRRRPPDTTGSADHRAFAGGAPFHCSVRFPVRSRVDRAVCRPRRGGPMGEYPQLLHTVLDCTNARELAEFYRQLLGVRYRSGDEPPTDGTPDDADWLVLTDANGLRKLAFQQVDDLPRATWPEPPGVPQQLHLDFTVPSRAELERQRQRAVALGAVILLNRTDDPDEPLYAFADLAGHPFCIFVA